MHILKCSEPRYSAMHNKFELTDLQEIKYSTVDKSLVKKNLKNQGDTFWEFDFEQTCKKSRKKFVVRIS